MSMGIWDLFAFGLWAFWLLPGSEGSFMKGCTVLAQAEKHLPEDYDQPVSVSDAHRGGKFTSSRWRSNPCSEQAKGMC